MAKFYYFDGRGRGEIVRLALAAASIPFVEETLSEREHFLTLVNDGKLLFDQVPLLEIDGKLIVQGNAIVRYLGRKAGLYGKNSDEELRIDEIYDGARDFYAPFYPLVFAPEKDILEGAGQKSIDKYLPHFEKILSKNGTGFLVGDSLTIADVSLLEALLAVVEYYGIDVLKDFPSVTKFYDVVTSDPRIAAYLNGPQRKRKNDQRYVDDVKRVLAWDNFK